MAGLAAGKSGQAGAGANADQGKQAQAGSSEGNQQTLQNEMSLSGLESSLQTSTKKSNRRGERQRKNSGESSKIQPKGKLEPSGLSEVTCSYSDPLSYHCSKLCNFERLPLNS